MNAVRTLFRASAVALASVLLFPIQALPQATKAGVVTTLQGTATVARAMAPQPMPLRFKDDVFIHDNIVTGENSIVRILLGGKAVVTVRERSALTIHETPTTSTIEVSSGKIALAVAKDRMKPGESVQIKTPNAMCGVRGTVVIAEVAPPSQPGDSFTSRFTLLTGIVDVSRLDPSTGHPTGQRVTLNPLQTIGVTGGFPLGALRTLSRKEAQSIASDYKISIPIPPAKANAQVTELQLEQARQHAAALGGTQGPADKAKGGGDQDETRGGEDKDRVKDDDRGSDKGNKGKDKGGDGGKRRAAAIAKSDGSNRIDGGNGGGGIGGSGGIGGGGGGIGGGIIGGIIDGGKQKSPSHSH
jgi:uncharacterized membrane protein YgcG